MREIKKSGEFYEWKELKDKGCLIYTHGKLPNETYLWFLAVVVSHILYSAFATFCEYADTSSSRWKLP